MIRLLAALCIASLLAAKSKPGLRTKVELPATYSKPLATSGNLDHWWLVFNDQHLPTLIERARQSNRDLQLAQARLLESRATTRQTRAALLPSATPSIGFTNSQRSNNSPAIPRFDAPAGAPSTDLIPRRYSLFDAGFDTSYEIDLFGGIRKSYSATKSDERAQLEDLNDTRLSITAEVARNYIDLREAQARRGIVQRSLDSLDQSLMLVRYRAQAGLTTQQEVIRLESQIASTVANLPQLESKIEQTLLAIALLTGDSASQLATELGDPTHLPSILREIPGDLPAKLLERRPDIRKAFAQLDAATARRQSAATDWFPKLKLTNSIGGQSGDFTNLLSASSIVSTFAPKLSWGALNYKQTRAAIQQKEAREAQQLASLDKTLLTAFKEVESALSSWHREQERLAHLTQVTAAQNQLAGLSRTRATAGLDSTLPTLEAERSELSALDQQFQSHANLLRNLVTLFKSLGGGW